MTATTDRARGAAVDIGLPAGLLAALVLPGVVLRDRLPGAVAVHWGLSGLPDRGERGGLALAAAVALWVLAWIAARRSGGGVQGRDALTAAAGVGGVLAAVGAVVVERNLDAAVWQDARPLGPLAVVLPFAVGAACAALARAIVPAPRAAASAGAPVLALGRGEHAVWVARVTSRPLLAGLAVAALAVGVAGTGGPGERLLGGGLLLLAGAALGTVRVTVNDRGLAVGFGPWGRPARRIPLARITGAAVETVAPLAYGGWGYRVLPRTTAVVLRAGPALAVDLVGGRRLVVTVDDPEGAAALLNALREPAR